MLFTEPTFLFLFLPVLLALCFAGAVARGSFVARGFQPSEQRSYANWILLIASVIFYAAGGGWFTLLMLASIAFNYRMAIAVDRARGTPGARARLATSVALNLMILGVFKYANFFSDNLNVLLGAAHVAPIAVPRVLLPIGISFFTFHAISYVVDVSRGDAVAQKSPVHAALYLLLFPQLIAGPIIRYRDIADQLARRRVTLDDFAYGVRRFVVGLGKKVLIANVVAGPSDRIFGMPADHMSAAHAWLGLICYTLQIYFDFSGYSDMAIGLGRMFGFRFPENFRWPYIADSVQGFWRRWHISLSTWFRDYLYIPLGGNRVGVGRQYRNLVSVFVLCGLWHGARWNFVIWGLWHGMFLVIERVVKTREHENTKTRNHEGHHPHHPITASPHHPIRSWPIWPHVYTMLVVMIGWVFFRADTLTDAGAYLQALAGLAAAAPTPYTVRWYLTPDLWLALVAGAIGSAPWVPALSARLSQSRPTVAWGASLASVMSLLAILLASVMQMAAHAYNPFIYFRF